MILRSNYDEIDFIELYKAQQAESSFECKSQADWDKKAAKFQESAFVSQYADEFLRRMELRAGDSVLDFACGAGVLSLKAAQIASQIYAYDYSEQMVKFSMQNAQTLGLSNIHVAQKAFEDNWSDIPVCDVVFASRCLEVRDLASALKKLISKTRRTLYMTFKVEPSFVDPEILEAIGRCVKPKPTYIYLVNILVQMGYLPCVSYILSPTHHSTTNAEELIKKTTWELGDKMSQSEEQRLREYFKRGKKAYEKPMKWAFISIDV